MNYVFTGLAIANTILFLLTAGTGYMAFGALIPRPTHIMAGLFIAIFTCLVHSIIFVYFIGTGKSIKTACEEFKLEGDFVRVTKKLKGRTFPFALFGSLSMMAAAFTGGAAATEAGSTDTHHAAVLTASILSAICFFFEYKAVCGNMVLLARLGNALPAADETP